jgi:hypothetical protein
MKKALYVCFLCLIFGVPVLCQEKVSVTAIKANLRGTPSSDGIIVTTVSQGEKFELIINKGAWYLVQTPKYVGWIHGNAISIDYSELDAYINRQVREMGLVQDSPNQIPRKTNKPPTTNSSPFQEEYVGGNVNPTIEIKNEADRTVTLILGGAKFVIGAGRTQSITLEPGNYEYFASAPGVNSLSGIKAYKVGYNYSWVFYISRY